MPIMGWMTWLNLSRTLLQARITVPYSGNLTIQLDDGASLSIPVRGVYKGVTYAPAVSHPCMIMRFASLFFYRTQPGMRPPASSGSDH